MSKACRTSCHLTGARDKASRQADSSTHTTHMDTGINMVNEVFQAEDEAAGEEEEEEAYFRTEHVSRTEELQMEVESATKVTP